MRRPTAADAAESTACAGLLLAVFAAGVAAERFRRFGTRWAYAQIVSTPSPIQQRGNHA